MSDITCYKYPVACQWRYVHISYQAVLVNVHRFVTLWIIFDRLSVYASFHRPAHVIVQIFLHAYIIIHRFLLAHLIVEIIHASHCT